MLTLGQPSARPTVPWGRGGAQTRLHAAQVLGQGPVPVQVTVLGRRSNRVDVNLGAVLL